MVASKEYDEKIEQNIMASEMMLSYMPKTLREKYSRPGIPTDTIAELLIAHRYKTLAENGNGRDLQNGIEVKFATITTYYRPKGDKSTEASICNLKSKTGDLVVVVADPRLEYNKRDNTISHMRLRFFKFPYKIWTKYIKGNKMTMSFGSDSWKWYMDYECSWNDLNRDCLATLSVV